MTYQTGPRIVTNGLVFCVDAADANSYAGSGTTWNDLSGNGNNGTLTNGPTFNSANRGSIVFDGANDYVKIPYSSALIPSNITVSAWINRKQAAYYAQVIRVPIDNISWNPPYSSYGVEYIGTSDTISFALGFTDNTFSNINVTVYGNNRWFYFVGTYDKNNVKVYIDGVLATTTAETKTLYNSTADLYLGTINTSAQYLLNGNIAQVSIYNRALSASEVAQNYNATKGRYGF